MSCTTPSKTNPHRPTSGGKKEPRNTSTSAAARFIRRMSPQPRPTPPRSGSRTSITGENGVPRPAQRCQYPFLQVVAIEEVVGIEGDEAAVGVDDVHARLLDRAHVERIGVDELHDQHAEH